MTVLVAAILIMLLAAVIGFEFGNLIGNLANKAIDAAVKKMFVKIAARRDARVHDCNKHD